MRMIKHNQTLLLAFSCAVLFGAIAFHRASNAAYFQADGKEEVIFDRDIHTSPPSSIFAVVFDDSDTPSIVELFQPEFISPARLEPPEIYNDPRGELVDNDPRFSAGGVGYGFSNNVYYAVLSLHPSPQVDGWYFYRYIYEVSNSKLIPVSIARTRTFNEFAAFTILPRAFFWSILGAISGFVLSRAVKTRQYTATKPSES